MCYNTLIMASDRQKFNRAHRKWQQMHDDRRYSADQSSGVVAVAYSRYSIEDVMSQQVRELANYYDEATEICEITEKSNRKARFYDSLTRATMSRILLDEAISDVVLIGHGSLSSIYLDSGELYDWQDVSRATTHLKKGVFMQRFCGNNLRTTSIPLGLFSVSSHSNVIAPLDRSFDPDDDPSDEYLLQRITDTPIDSYVDAKQRFPINPAWKRWIDQREDASN